jgi:hypothetical protein
MAEWFEKSIPPGMFEKPEMPVQQPVTPEPSAPPTAPQGSTETPGDSDE